MDGTVQDRLLPAGNLAHLESQPVQASASEPLKKVGSAFSRAFETVHGSSASLRVPWAPPSMLQPT